jgi:hypothetical protein
VQTGRFAGLAGCWRLSRWPQSSPSRGWVTAGGSAGGKPSFGADVVLPGGQGGEPSIAIPGGNVPCQTTHVEFACQKSGKGVAGQAISGCGQAKKP